MIFFTGSLIFHQLLTRNQTFIFFLIPILFAFSHISLGLIKVKSRNLITIIFILICFFATAKYHVRFNENRKFHELNYVDFKFSADAAKIDKKFKGLKWITPEHKNSSNEEIDIVNSIKNHLINDNRKKMLMTNYSFFSTILNEKLYSPSRWYIFDGTDYPLKENKYYDSYKNLLIKVIKDNKIKVIYTVYPAESSLVYTYLDQNCFEEIKISKVLSSHEIKNCY